jgi:hypothetical protein
VFIDLRPGAFSSAAKVPTLAEANAAVIATNAITDDTTGDAPLWTQASLDAVNGFIQQICSGDIADYTGVSGVQAMAFENISIAYNTVIENAVGGPMRDYIVGNDAANHLYGGGGDDVLNGLGGADTLTGGTGADEFRFTELGATDRIDDYGLGADFLNLSEIDANPTSANDDAFSVVSAFTNAPGQLLLTYSALTNWTTVSLDVNGDGVSDMDILLKGHVTDTSAWLI